MTSQLWLPQAAQSPSPAELAAYLRQDRWVLVHTDASWALYRKELAGEAVELEVPQLAAAPDYGRAVALLLEDLARLKGRRASEVLRDVRASAVDIVRLAIDGPATRDGRIPVEAGRRVFQGARDLFLSAACAVLDPRAVLAKRKPEEAMQLLSRARFGQTEVGSFVLTIECPLTPRLQATLPLDETDAEAPLERRTCLRLADALSAMEYATRASVASGRLDPFRERTGDGLSANLCDAVAEILEAASADTLKASFSFASMRPLARPVPRGVVLSSDMGPVLREASARMREEATYPGTEVMGTVVRLDSSDPTEGGVAVLRVDVEGRVRSVRVKLAQADYQQAILAHGDRALIRCTGELAREGATWVLRQPREFGVSPEQDGA
jgi:hypothetical protein